MIFLRPFLILIMVLSLGFSEYQISAGDTVLVDFKIKKEFATKQVVSTDGNINLPLIKIIKVTGMTQTELQSSLEKEYAKFITADSPLVYIEPRPIYIIWHDLKDDSLETKIARTPEEAKALCGEDYTGDIQPGQTIEIKHGRPISWWENNWYKLVSALALIISIVK